MRNNNTNTTQTADAVHGHAPKGRATEHKQKLEEIR